MPSGVDVVFLREQTQGRLDPEQALHQVTSALPLADDRQSRDEPERADQERAFLARESVVGLVRLVTEHVSVLGELVGDCKDGRPQALILRWKEPKQRRQEDRRIQRIGVVVLSEDAATVDSMLEDVCLDLVSGVLPGRT